MDYQQIREYQIRRRAKNVAETPWLIFPGKNKLTRRLLKLSFIKDQLDTSRFIGVHAEVLYQRRKNQKEPWPARTVDLTTVPRGFGFKFSLDSEQTFELAQALQDAYSIGSGRLVSGKRTVLRDISRDEIIVAEADKAAILERINSLLNKEDMKAWLTDNLSALPTDLAIARLYHHRKAQLDDFRSALERSQTESFWQRFLKENSWIFGSACIEILSERRLDIHHETDFPIRVEGGFMDIVEIKTPQFPFWALSGKKRYKYRNKFLVPHEELQGAIAQTTKYILQAEKRLDSEEYIRDHGGVVPLKPRGLIVHGRSDDWTANEWEAFRLLNDELHTVQVITFDHLLKQAERILSVTRVTEDNPPLEDVEFDDLDLEDIPF